MTGGGEGEGREGKGRKGEGRQGESNRIGEGKEEKVDKERW